MSSYGRYTCCLACGVHVYDPPCGQSIVFGCFPFPSQARRRRAPLLCWRSREPEHHRRWTNWGWFEQMGEFGAFITFICWLFKSCVIWFADVHQRYIPFWSDFRGTLGIVHVLHSCLKAFGTLNHRPISGGVKSTLGTVERVLNSAWD